MTWTRPNRPDSTAPCVLRQSIHLRRWARVGILAGVVLLPRHDLAQDAVPDLLAKAGSYLHGYEARFAAVISQEDYRQMWTRRFLGQVAATADRRSIETKAQFLILLAEPGVWLGYRDVFEVDGKPVPDHLERLAKLLATPASESASAAALANQILVENARYNLGTIRRNINVPTMALTFLRADQQARSSFKKDGVQHTDHGDAFVLSFTEKARPTLVRSDNGKDAPAAGRFWIEASGRVDRTELTLTSDDGIEATITVVYGPQPKVDVWVPISMQEHYARGELEKIDASASYSDFMVPTVNVDVSGFAAAGRRGGGGGQSPSESTRPR